MLPARVREPLRDHLARMKRQHDGDLARGAGSVWLPDALSAKYPRAPWEWGWQWVFPATRTYRDRATGHERRHHLHETMLQRAVKEASVAAGLTVRASPHALRRSFATHLLPPHRTGKRAAGTPARIRQGHPDGLPRRSSSSEGASEGGIQELLVHHDVSTTMVYTHVLNRGGLGVKSPLDE